MSKILEIAREALQQMPPQTRLRPEDEAVIARHKELLLSWTPELVQGFYDTLFAHTPTRSVFHEGSARRGRRPWWTGGRRPWRARWTRSTGPGRPTWASST
jgi:hypothetical protein